MTEEATTLILEALEQAAESEIHDPGKTDPELFLDAAETIERLIKELKSLRSTLLEANAEIQNLRSAGVVY
jgi:molecular chaperone GrpE (heat shock protein)